jgi:rod shape-determining protein MreC
MVGSQSNKNPARIPALGFRALALVVLSILLMWLDNREHHLDAVRRVIGVAVYPIQIVVDTPARAWAWMRDLSASKNQLQLENSRLRTEALITRARMQELAALKAENDRLRAMLDAREQVRGEVRVAGIMAVDANPYRHNIVLDVGTREGVYDGQAIVDASGVVGQVISTGLTTSQAILISDPDHALPVVVNRNGLRTVAFGTGEYDRLSLPFLANNADIQPGDLLVTSGLGGAFPSGYPVAVVENVTRLPQEPFAEVTATPAAALDQVREVMLIWVRTQDGGAEDE